MAIVATDITAHQTLNGLGGAMLAPATTGLLASITEAELLSGVTVYSCEYVRNNHATIDATDFIISVASETVAPGINIRIGLGSSAINAEEQTVADKSTAPAGVTFADADGIANGLSVGILAPLETKAMWFEIIIDPNTAIVSSYQLVIDRDLKSEQV